MKRNLNNVFISLICGLVLAACGTNSGSAGNSNFSAPIPMGISSIPLNTPTGPMTATAIVNGSPSTPNLNIDPSTKTVSGTISLTPNVNYQMYLQFAVGSVVIGTTKTQTISVTPGGSTAFNYAPTDINYNHGAVFTLTNAVLHPVGIDVVTGSDGDPATLYVTENSGNNDIKAIDLTKNPISISTIAPSLAGPVSVVHAPGISGSSGYLYFVDGDNRIKKVDLASNNAVTTICGTGIAGNTNGSCSGISPTAQFTGPVGLALKQVYTPPNCRVSPCTNGFTNDYLIVSENNSSDLRYIDVSGNTAYLLANTNPAPGGISYDSKNDNVYFANGTHIAYVPGPISTALVNYYTTISGPSPSTTFSSAWAVFFDFSTGQIYIADNTNHIIYTGMPAGTTLTFGTPFIGNGAATSADNVGLSASVNNIADIKGTSKFLFLSDYNDNVIRVVVR